MIADLWEDMIGKFVIIFIGIILLGFATFFLELKFHESTEMRGIVLEKLYTPSHTSTGTGYAATSNGGAVVVTTSYEPEQHEVIIESDNVIYKVTMSMQEYAKLKIGDETNFWKVVGSFTGLTYGYFK